MMSFIAENISFLKEEYGEAVTIRIVSPGNEVDWATGDVLVVDASYPISKAPVLGEKLLRMMMARWDQGEPYAKTQVFVDAADIPVQPSEDDYITYRGKERRIKKVEVWGIGNPEVYIISPEDSNDD